MLSASLNKNISFLPSNCILGHDRVGGDSVMVWAGIDRDGRTAMVRVNGVLNAQVYRDGILPLVNVTGGVFQRDNAGPHTARVCRDFLQQNNVHVLSWPAR